MTFKAKDSKFQTHRQREREKKRMRIVVKLSLPCKPKNTPSKREPFSYNFLSLGNYKYETLKLQKWGIL